VKPHQTLIFLVGVFLSIALIMLAFPADGIRISGDKKLEMPKLSQLFEESIQYANISNIIGENAIDTANLLDYDEIIYRNVFKNNSQNFQVVLEVVDTLSIEVGSISSIQRLQFPNGDKSVLDNFFRDLQNPKEGVIRIVHYGDSQLEGDRITSVIRQNLQKQFGGSGPGLLPALQPYNYGITIKQKNSSNWLRYNTMEHSNSVKGQRFGILAGFSRFAPIRGISSDSASVILADTAVKSGYSGTITFSRSDMAYKNNNFYKQVRVFYGYNQTPVKVGLYADEQLVEEKILPANKQLMTAKWSVNSPEKLVFKFSGGDSPEIYAIGLDAEKGIAVDNVPQRGSAGFVFTTQNKELLKAMLNELDVRLMILEFGGNVTPYVTDNYDYYGNMFGKQLAVIREIKPDISIIVIGPADMSINQGGTYVSYPNIPNISATLRKAAFKYNAVYWDMYEAMGGKNSMPSWVYHDPPLAGKDFIHFTRLGSEIISKIFYNALIMEYNDYLKRKNK